MFTGIIETIGNVKKISTRDGVLDLWIRTPLVADLQIDQSVAHNGICLTVVAVAEDSYCVSAVEETINKTTIGRWQVGDAINLERALKVGDRLDGHFVQGHVDTVGTCVAVSGSMSNRIYQFEFPKIFAGLMIEKGSICIDGVSLTAFQLQDNSFSVTIIPYTYEHTTFQMLEVGSKVNLEFDVLGKYFLRNKQLASSSVL